MPASFVTISPETRAYGSHPFYYISHEPYNEHTQFHLEAAFVRGSIPMCASLSPDGQFFALHNHEGEVQVDTKNNTVVSILKGGFGIAEQLIWTRDSSQLLVHTKYGDCGLYFFEISANKELFYKSLAIPSHSQDVTSCCPSADNTLLVCTQRTHAFVFNFLNKAFLYSFPLAHCIKRAHINFIERDILGVRTDYGCFSTYQL